jgi:prepilin-type N-terminal cleavage/methylation domain-containing protein
MKKMLTGKKKGFTLIELLVVVMIIGILASIAVPQYFKVVEKGKTAEALDYVDVIKAAQERYLAKNGNYCTGAANPQACLFDVTLPTSLKFFDNGTLGAGSGSPGFSLTVTRIAGNGTLPATYGGYQVFYDRNATTPLTCQGGTNNTACATDLMP